MPKLTTPFLNKTVDSYFKKFVVGQGPMRHNDAIIEFIERSPSLGGSVIVAQFHHLPFALVEPQLVAGGRVEVVAALG